MTITRKRPSSAASLPSLLLAVASVLAAACDTPVTPPADEPTRLVVGTTNGLLVSADEGASWTSLLVSTSSDPKDQSALFSCLSANGSSVYAGLLYGGLYASNDPSGTWGAFSIGIDEAAGISGQYALYATDTALYVSTNAGLFVASLAASGLSWRAITSADNGLPNDVVCDVHLDGSTLYAATMGGLGISTDGGVTWASSAARPNRADDDGGIQKVVSSGSAIYVTSDSGLSVSPDGGQSWTIYDASTDGFSDGFVTDLCLSGGKLYAACTDGLFVTADSGSSWTKLLAASDDELDAIAQVAERDGTLYALGFHALMTSTDGGSSWTTMSLSGELASGVECRDFCVY